MTRRTLWVIAFGLAVASQARGDVDLTGRWKISTDSTADICIDVVQSGTSLTGQFCPNTATPSPWTGTVDPTSGEFTLSHPDNDSFCAPPPSEECVTCGHATVSGTATADGVSFSGDLLQSVLVFPGLCAEVDFAAEGTRVVCGNHNVEIGERCDDGNATDGDCCSSTCAYEPQGSSCSLAGSLCTVGQCDDTGTCASAPPTNCRSPGKSVLLIRSPDGPSRDKWIWRWLHGPQTTQTDFGDPTAATDYALCLYAGTAQAVLAEATVQADADKWRPVSSTGYQYNDRAGSQEGVTKILLKGGPDGNAKALVKGKGLNLPDPPLGYLPLPVTARLVGSGSAACFEAVYDTGAVTKNDTTQFKAKTP